ncbi:MAG TPA: hypothetical protein VMM76_19880 [Pirellulaceae bacterium]|nr:hypothetical protein [Pirellulaceae bacterium]
MNTAAHEPRRVGPRRADSPPGSKVTPRRNAPETSEQDGAQYDSDELPVLIRLPNLGDLGPVETQIASESKKKRHRIDPPSASKQKRSRHEASKGSKKTFQQQAGGNKLVLVGVVGGMLVVVMLFVFNASGPTPPADQDDWAKQDSGVLLEVPEVSISAANNSPPSASPPDFTYTAPGLEEAQFASGELAKTPLGPPDFDMPLLSREAETNAPTSRQPSVSGWPSEETMGASAPSAPTPTNLWPGESLSLEPPAYQYPPTDSPSQGDYRSSMYPPDADTYRMGKLSSDRQGDHSSILDGNIAIPDTKSLDTTKSLR